MKKVHVIKDEKGGFYLPVRAVFPGQGWFTLEELQRMIPEDAEIVSYVKEEGE